MEKTLLNFWIDALSFFNILIISFTGFILKYGFCRGRSENFDEILVLGRTFWGLTRSQWGEIHFVFAQILCLLVILHIYLHWKWIKNVFAKYYFS